MPGQKQSGGFSNEYLFHLSSRQSSSYNEGINLGDNTNTLEARQLSFHDHNAFPLLAVQHMPWI